MSNWPYARNPNFSCMSSLVDWGRRGLLAWNYGERLNYGGTKVKKGL